MDRPAYLDGDQDYDGHLNPMFTSTGQSSPYQPAVDHVSPALFLTPAYDDVAHGRSRSFSDLSEASELLGLPSHDVSRDHSPITRPLQSTGLEQLTHDFSLLDEPEILDNPTVFDNSIGEDSRNMSLGMAYGSPWVASPNTPEIGFPLQDDISAPIQGFSYTNSLSPSIIAEPGSPFDTASSHHTDDSNPMIKEEPFSSHPSPFYPNDDVSDEYLSTRMTMNMTSTTSSPLEVGSNNTTYTNASSISDQLDFAPEKYLAPVTGRQRSSSFEVPGQVEGYLSPNLAAISSANTSTTSLSPTESPTSPSQLEVPTDHEVRRARSASFGSSRNRGSTSRSRSRSQTRDYMLELASPNQSHRRVQKHPSVFGCHLCDKRFTRAYNLRSHLRSHTDERPYVCSICGKAFARQHDRKRHEALHSGEKKYECKGILADGVTKWGCGKKFARADALGRHFRTEAGKECISPLVKEDEQLRSTTDDAPIYLSNGTGESNGAMPSLMLSPPEIEGRSAFPSALLQQFPSLNRVSWETTSTSEQDDD